MKNRKYYALHKATPKEFDIMLREFEESKRAKIEKKLDKSLPYMLIEKTMHVNSSETITNLWSIPESGYYDTFVGVHTKGKKCYDYLNPYMLLVHEGDKVLTWEQYKENKALFEIKLKFK